MRKFAKNLIAVLLCVTGLILLAIPSQNIQAVSNQGDFIMDGRTLSKYTGHQAELTLPDFITTIGKDAFSGNVSLRSVIIPSSVKTIDYAAFENCTNLYEVYIPESVRTIGSSAFSGCTSLFNVNIPKKTESIGSGAFAGCPSLYNVFIDEDNPYFICNDSVIYTADGKEIVQYLAGRPSSTYSFPASVEKINEYAFWGATNLTGVSISQKITEIPEYAFANCPGLSTVVIPNSVTKIMAYSFSDCSNLQNAVIPRSVGYIDDMAFYMSNGVNVEFVSSSTQYEQSSDVSQNSNSNISNDLSGTDLNLPISDTDSGVADSYYDYTYPAIPDYEDNITPGEIGSTKVVGSQAVLLMSPEMKVKESFNLNYAEAEDGISKNFKNTGNTDEFSIIRSVLDSYNGTMGDVTIPNDVIKIGNRCFYRNNSLSSVTIPSSVNELGDFSFARSSITSVNIPNSVKEIGYAAFYQCENLSEINIPDSVEKIELGAFLGTPYLTNWQMTDDSDNYLIVGDKILLSYKGEGGNITIPEGVKTIAPGCFLGNTTITGVSIPSSVLTIGEDAFCGCTSLNTISFSSGLETIEDRAFRNTSLSALTIPPTVKSIGLGAFDINDEAPLNTVLFMGTEMPDVSYKPTASRLSASELRTPAFDGIENAIIRDTAGVNSGNIFNSDNLGFRGAIFTLSGSEGDSGSTLNLIKCNKEPDDNGIVDIESEIIIGNTTYQVTGVLEGAFKDYKNISKWSDKPLKEINISGNPSSELDALLDSIGETEKINYTEDNCITVNDNRMIKGKGTLKAVIPNNTEPYIVNIDDCNESKELFASAFINSLGNVISGNISCYDINMTDSTGTVRISKMNKSKIELTIPVPDNFKGSNDLIVVSLNDNGALETISTAPVNNEYGESIKFVTGHFSPFAICHAESLYYVSSGDTTIGNGQIDDQNMSEDFDELTESDESMESSQNIFNLNASSGTLIKDKIALTPVTILSVILIIVGIVLLIFNIFSNKKKKY